VPEHTTTLDAVAAQIRSKNAGPFWVTFDVFFTTDDEYRWVLESGVICQAAIGDLHVVKVSFPRHVVGGNFDDRDLHAGQQHVLLAGLTVPVRSAPAGAAITEGNEVT
jgi:hypothetical protein